MNLREELSTAINLTYEAGVEIMRIYERQCEVMYKEDKSPVTPYTASPLEGAGAITVTATGFPITMSPEYGTLWA